MMCKIFGGFGFGLTTRWWRLGYMSWRSKFFQSSIVGAFVTTHSEALRCDTIAYSIKGNRLHLMSKSKLLDIDKHNHRISRNN